MLKRDIEQFLDLYRIMFTSREVDRLEEQLTGRGEAFFTVSGAGHETVAALNEHLIPEDWLHCHYRDKSLMLARGISPEMFFHSLFAKDASHSKGRQMSAHMSDRELNIMSLVGPVGNSALQAVGVAVEVKNGDQNPIVLCAMGDGTSQQGEVLEAIAEAVRRELPVLFLVEDNQYAISTRTRKKTFFSHPDKTPNQFYGMEIHRLEGRDPIACHNRFGEIVKGMRETRKPEIIVLEVERLSNHTNADDQRIYRDNEEIMQVRAEADPIANLKEQLLAAGVGPHIFTKIETEVRTAVAKAARESQVSPDPEPVFTAKKPLPGTLQEAKFENRGDEGSKERLTMLEAMRSVFETRMSEDSRITLYGQDIEDPKGDVFGLTRELTDKFPGRVENSPLSESTIVGVSVGRALGGGKPVAFLQFADFLPLAFNQIISELGSIYWRTDGSWQSPVIVMLTCGGYRPGLGPFHAQTLEAVAAHTPGVDVFMPATAGDAAGLLNAAFDSDRPTLFFYPKSCLNDRDVTTSPDVRRQLVPIGIARLDRVGQDLTFVCWGNTVTRCRKAAEALESEGVTSTVIDLRSLSPWDEDAVLQSVRRTGRLLVSHEDGHTCGMAAEILATVAEKAGCPVISTRVTRADTYVPYNFSNQLEVLPSFKRILTAACELVEMDVSWILPPEQEAGIMIVEAVGTSPSDESVTIVEWMIAAGDTIETGQVLAVFEADKAAAELLSPIDGMIEEILIEEDDTVKVGTPILRICLPEGRTVPKKPVTQEISGTPVLKRRAQKELRTVEPGSKIDFKGEPVRVGIFGMSRTLGSRTISNDQILKKFPDKTNEDIERTTGIKSRRWVSGDEDVLTLATSASKKVLFDRGLTVGDLDMIICSTGTPLQITPSLSCRVLYELGGEKLECQASDISAACTGYLYALQIAYDFIQQKSDALILLITAEVLSPLLNMENFSTAIIFGDAATATLIGGESMQNQFKAEITRPVLSARGEPGEYLTVPVGGCGQFVTMQGSKVFSEGVRKMSQMLKRACSEKNIEPQDLDLIIPHQANQRIIDAIRNRLSMPVERIYSNIRDLGNTSSNTIPLCLFETLPEAEPGKTWGLTAFGGGFTYGAGLLYTK